MTKGDILFYRALQNPQTWQERLEALQESIIVKRTGSQIVHCSVAWDTGLSIGAESIGVSLVDAGTPYAEAATTTNLPNSELAFQWLLKQIGNVYGFGDVMNQGLNLLPGSPTIALNKMYDCSDLCVRFLAIGGYPLPIDMVLSPQNVTPGQLYDTLKGVIG